MEYRERVFCDVADVTCLRLDLASLHRGRPAKLAGTEEQAAALTIAVPTLKSGGPYLTSGQYRGDTRTLGLPAEPPSFRSPLPSHVSCEVPAEVWRSKLAHTLCADILG